MKLDEAKALANDVDVAAKALNKAITTAALAGMVVELRTLDATQIGTYGVTVVEVAAKVRPSDIEVA